MEKNKYDKFLSWLSEKEGLSGCFTSNQVDFAKQFFDILNDYPSLEEKISELGSKRDTFFLIERYLKSGYVMPKLGLKEIPIKKQHKSISDDNFIKKIKTI